jgi:hypothetical protein
MVGAVRDRRSWYDVWKMEVNRVEAGQFEENAERHVLGAVDG